jgi:regulatory protein
MSGAEDQLQHALELAYRFLNRRERTAGEVRGQLQRQALGPATIEAAIQILLEQGYLDDARYARLFAQDKRELEGWGADRIRRTLLERSIPREMVDQLLSEPTPETELERALALLRRRYSSPPRDRRERDRALGVLLRKGYDSELALHALTAYGGEADEPGWQHWS